MSHIEEIRAQSNNITTKQIANYFSKFYHGDNVFYQKGTKLIRFIQDIYTTWIDEESFKDAMCTNHVNGVYFLNGVFAFGGTEHADHFQLTFENFGGSVMTITDPHFKNDKDLLVTFQVADSKVYQTAQGVVDSLNATGQCGACIFFYKLRAHGPEAFKIVLKTHDIDDVEKLVSALRISR